MPDNAWAAVSCYADPLQLHVLVIVAMDIAAWNWERVPANFARVVLDSGVLRHVKRVVELGAEYAGRCVAAVRCCANGSFVAAKLKCRSYYHDARHDVARAPLRSAPPSLTA